MRDPKLPSWEVREAECELGFCNPLIPVVPLSCVPPARLFRLWRMDGVGEVLCNFSVLDNHVLGFIFVKSYVAIIGALERHYVPIGGARGCCSPQSTDSKFRC